MSDEARTAIAQAKRAAAKQSEHMAEAVHKAEAFVAERAAQAKDKLAEAPRPGAKRG